MKQKIEDLYLDWFNNFLSVEKFASYHDFSIEKAERIILIGRKLYNRRLKS